MKKKKFTKIAMSQGMTRNEAIFAAKVCILNWGSYEIGLDDMRGIIQGRFECYMNDGYVNYLLKRRGLL